jgi:hypothetical protein
MQTGAWELVRGNSHLQLVVPAPYYQMSYFQENIKSEKNLGHMLCCVLCIYEVSFKKFKNCSLHKNDKGYVNSSGILFTLVFSFFYRSHMFISWNEILYMHKIQHNPCPRFYFTLFRNSKMEHPIIKCGRY